MSKDKIKLFVLVFFSILIVMYLGYSFILLDMNVFNWPLEFREAMIDITFSIYFCFIVLYGLYNFLRL